MTRPLVVLPEAEAEMGEAFDWYERQRLGLGDEFLLALDAALQAILRDPEHYPKIHRTVRRALLRRFPFGVHFLIEPERILIVAVFHARRDPGHWRERIPS